MKSPILYLADGTTEENRKAHEFLSKSGIDFELAIPASDGLGVDETPPRPLLTDKFGKYVGIEEIKEFIEDYRMSH